MTRLAARPRALAVLFALAVTSSCDTPTMPVIQSLAATGLPASPGAEVVVTVEAQSPDGRALRYAWVAEGGFVLASGADGASVTLQAPQGYGASGMLRVTVSDPDGNEAVGAIALATVGNLGPSIHSVVADPNPIRREATATIRVEATDPNDDSLTYAWAVPPGFTIESGEGTAEIVVRAPLALIGGTVSVAVGDGERAVNGALHVAAREGQWVGPHRVEDGSSGNNFPQIAAAPNGDAFAVYRFSEAGPDGSIYAVRYSHVERAWGEPFPLEEGEGYATFPRVACDPAGNAIVVWPQLDAVAIRAYANRFDAGTGTWSGPVVLDPAASNVGVPALAIDADGNALVVWARDEGAAKSLYTARFSASTGAWEPPTPIEALAGKSEAPDVAFDGLGNAFVAWRQTVGSELSVHGNRYEASTGAWLGSFPIHEADGYVLFPDVAAGPDGSAMVVWNQEGSGDWNAYASRFDPGAGAFEAPILLDAGAGSAHAPRVVVDARGNAIVVWYQNSQSTYSVYSRRYDAVADAFQAAVLLEDDDESAAQFPEIALDPRGNAIAVWLRTDGGTEGIYANRYTATTNTWRGAESIEDGAGGVFQAVVALDAEGRGFAGWHVQEGADNRVFLNRYE